MIRAALFLFCRKIEVVNRSVFSQKGPLLVVANHPNSFLDAIIIGSIFTENVHFLARGDAFRQKKHRFLLKMLKMIPIYRISEGKENLHLNEYAFAESNQILQAGGIVLIFIEGICINSHQLQPFKKGAARIALDANTPQSLHILPISISYDSFSAFGKNVRIEAAQPMLAQSLFPFKEEAKNLLHFNQAIQPVLNSMIQPPKPIKKHIQPWQFILAQIGKHVHYPLYVWVNKWVRQKTTGTVFYDSVLFGVLFLIYPLYLLIPAILLFLLGAPLLLVLGFLLMHIFGALCASRWLKK